jgi:hypothetical protein
LFTQRFLIDQINASAETQQPDVLISESVIADNRTQGLGAHGGGLYNAAGTVVVEQSTVRDNRTHRLGANGGGIANAGSLVIGASTIAYNRTQGLVAAGGGIANLGGSLHTYNTTIAENRTQGLLSGGAGIANLYGDVTLTNTTVAFNRAQSLLSVGGGIYNVGDPITLNNTLVADNRAWLGEDIFGALMAYYSLIGRTQGATFQVKDHCLLNVDAKLDKRGLADNGGPTLTIALQPGSRAIDGGSNALAIDAQQNPLTTDQRGQNRFANGLTDIGAFETPSKSSKNRGKS